jgi:hypothetical protein
MFLANCCGIILGNIMQFEICSSPGPTNILQFPSAPISLPDLASVSQKKLTEKQSSSRWPMLHVHTKHKTVKTKSDVRCLRANPPNIALTRIFLCQCTAQTYYTLIMSCPNTSSRPSYLLPRGPFNGGCVVGILQQL